jgi:hypothetical protein
MNSDKGKSKRLKIKKQSPNIKAVLESAEKSIDELFEAAAGKKKKRETEVISNNNEDQVFEQSKKPKAKKSKSVEKGAEVTEESGTYGVIQSRYPKMKIVNPEAPIERIDPETGFPVYKAHLLKVGDGGGTPLCPFDCNCCF